jgi:hypothetical protein
MAVSVQIVAYQSVVTTWEVVILKSVRVAAVNVSAVIVTQAYCKATEDV